MSTLSELYITMENLHKLNPPIDDRLKQDTAKLEEDFIRNEVLPTLTEKIESALAHVQRELVPGAPLKVSLSRKRNITDDFPDAVEIKPDPVDDTRRRKRDAKRCSSSLVHTLFLPTPSSKFCKL